MIKKVYNHFCFSVTHITDKKFPLEYFKAFIFLFRLTVLNIIQESFFMYKKKYFVGIESKRCIFQLTGEIYILKKKVKMSKQLS